MQTDPSALKSHIAVRKRDIASLHGSGADGFATSRALTSSIDEAILSAYECLPPGAKDSIAILALGSYGRGELSPYSDIDIMVLTLAEEHPGPAGTAAQSLLHYLWDAGLEIGHSVRTMEDVMGLYGKTFDAWTSMIESRHICGSARLSGDLHAGILGRISEGPNEWFIGEMIREVQARHERYGSSVKLLEPDIKKSAGGLRDLHTVSWLYRGTDPLYCIPAAPGECATKTFLDKLRTAGLATDEEHSAALGAFEFLLRVRHQMHYLRESRHDTLEYQIQKQAAGRVPVDEFMRRYYIHARVIQRFLERFVRQFSESLDPPAPAGRAGRRTGSAFFLYDDTLAIDPSVAALTGSAQVFEAFTLAAENEVPPDLRLCGLMEKSAGLIQDRDRDSPVLASYFRRILRSHRVAETLHRMNDMEILPRYIPEFGDLVAFFQHNVYHYYTADEHTLFALAVAENLREKQGILREVFRNLPRKDVLYAAILLHDIAKPRGVADHEITGVAMSAAILRRLGMADASDDVGFLVRHHLAMEQTAFRRNIHDPDTLKEFASRFPRAELLDYLYILTYADLSALNASVWTEWKAAMLQELYQRTAEVLRRNLTAEGIDRFQREKHDETAEGVVEALRGSVPPEEVRRHIAGVGNAAYVALFNEEEIGEHIRRAAGAEPVSALFARGGGHTEITVIARDAPYALSKFCAVLSANDADIFDANVFTRDDGIIIDRFRVTDSGTKEALGKVRCDKIAGDLDLVMQGGLDIEQLFRDHDRKWKRRLKTPADTPAVADVRFEENPRYTLIDVYAPDSVGFLYRVTETMSDLGLDIYFAKIATRVDGIVDAFYTLDRSGKQVTDPAKRETIREKLIVTIRRLADERLDRTS